MHRCLCLVVGLLLFSRPAWAQATADSPALQAILNELRQIHQDLRTTSIVAQRSQILLYRLQSQEAAVARASQRLDDAHAKLAEVQGNQKKTAAQIQDYRNWMRDNSENATATQKKNMEDAIAQFQAKLEAQGSEEQQRQSREIEADQQFRLEQAKLTALQDQLDQLDRELQSPAHSAK